MGTTPRTATPYPDLTDPPNGPGQFQAALAALEKFAVPDYTDAAARNSSIGTPAAGEFPICYLSTPKIFTWWDGTAWRGEWTSFSPACQFNASATNVTSSGEYLIDMNGIVRFEIQFNVTGAVGAGNFTATLPFAVRTLNRSSPTVAYNQRIGQATIIDSGSNWRSGAVVVRSGAASTAQIDTAFNGPEDLVRQTSPMTWANGDGGLLVGSYRPV